MTREEILGYAKDIVEEFGRETNATKYIPKLNEEGVVDGRTEIKVILDRNVSYLFGFDIAFFEESDDLAAIWFCEELVFNTLGDEYDPDMYDVQSVLLMKIVDDESGEVFVHGEWENALRDIAVNRRKINRRLRAEMKETEETNAWIEDLNSRMLKFLPFKYHERELGDLALRDYTDELVYVVGDLENRDSLKVYLWLSPKPGWFSRAGNRQKELVFDYSNLWYSRKGQWLSHIERIMYNQQIKYADKAVNAGYSPSTWERPKPSREQVQLERNRNRNFCLDKIRQYIE